MGAACRKGVVTQTRPRSGLSLRRASRAWFRVGLLLAGVFAAGPVLAQVSAPTGSALQPRLVIQDGVYDFGAVDEGAVVSHEFKIQNSGRADLRIEKAVPTCGCTISSVPEGAIPADSSAPVLVKFDSTGFTGRVEKQIKLFSNDAAAGVATLTLQGEIRPMVEVVPPSVSFGKVAKGTGGTKQQVSLRVRDGSPAEIGEVRSFDRNILVADVEGDARARRFSVSLSPEAPAGDMRSRVVVRVKGAKHSSINVPVFAAVSGLVELQPKSISLGLLQGSETIQRKVRLINNGTDPVAIVGVSSSDPQLHVAHRVVRPGREYEIAVTLDPKELQRDVRAEVTVKTDAAEEERVTFGVYGVLPPK